MAKLGQLDSASLYDVVAAFTFRRPADAYPWAVQSAVTVTDALLFTRSLQIAASPGQAGSAGGAYGDLCDGLRGRLDWTSRPAPSDEGALGETNRWVMRWPHKAASELARLKQAEHDSFHDWLGWMTRNAWLEHSQRLDGLFRTSEIPAVARVLRRPVADITRAQSDSMKPEVLRRYAHGYRDERYDVLADSYVVAALVRGRFHDLATPRSRHRLHHPLRHGVLPVGRATHRTEFRTTAVQHWFVLILLASAYRETRRDNRRVHRFVANVRRAQDALDCGAILVPQADPGSVLQEDVAFRAALAAARELEVDIHSSTLDTVIDAATTMGVAAATTFVLDPWIAIGVSGASLAARKLQPDARRAQRRVIDRAHRVEDLARAIGGRLTTTWISK